MVLKGQITRTAARVKTICLLVILLALGAAFYGTSMAALSPTPLSGEHSSAVQLPEAVDQNNNGTIAYVSYDHDQDEIWLIDPDGSENRRLWSPGPLGEQGPARITGLSWRPDAGSLAFASSHEALCSWYASDVYTIYPNGSGLRRVTNAPNCAALGGYPSGTVTVTVENATLGSALFGVYVQGAPGLQTILLGPFSSGMLTFDNVADLGDVAQPAVVIYGGYRWFTAAQANVLPGQTVHAGTITVSGEGFWLMGANNTTWRRDGGQIGYTTTYCGVMRQISPNAPDGHIGEPLINNEDASPCIIDWGPTAGTTNQILYYMSDFWADDQDGIYLVNEGSSTPGTRLIATDSFEGETIFDVKWLPDGSGFLFTMTHWDLGFVSDIFEYNLSTGTITQLTNLNPEDELYARNISISPDGQQVVFELGVGWEETGDIWIMQRNGTNLQLLVSNAGHPAWSPGAVQMPVFRYLFIPIVMR